jgi:hypothetical protein
MEEQGKDVQTMEECGNVHTVTVILSHNSIAQQCNNCCKPTPWLTLHAICSCRQAAEINARHRDESN